MVYYWNKEYFEGLKEVGETYKTRMGFELFGEYCLKKEQGLKKAANKAASNFVSAVEAQSLPTQRDIVIHICELRRAHQEVHSLTNHTIETLITNVLKAWTEEGTAPITTYHWYVQFCGYDKKQSVLEQIFKIDPNDQFGLQSEISQYFRDLDWVTHHLYENIILLENTQTAHEILQKIESRLPKITDIDHRLRYQTEFDYYQTLFSLWDKYQSVDRDLAFVDWAKLHHDFEV